MKLLRRAARAVVPAKPTVPRWPVLHEPPATPRGMVTGPPDFVGLGAQKSGTTWWCELLRSHPRVHMPDFSGHACPAFFWKERHFFDRFFRDPFGPEDVATYHRWFPRPRGTITGEWTPRYLVDPWTAPLLARAAPNCKLLVLLRDPVSRFESGMAHRQRDDQLSADDAVAHYSRGLYHRQLSEWLKYFPADSFLLLQFERCTREPAAQWTRTLQFLQLEDHPFPAEHLLRRVNRRSGETNYTIPPSFKQTLISRYEPEVAGLKELMPDLDVTLWPHFAHLT